MAHNKYLIPLSYLLINCISAKSTPQMLSLTEEETLLYLNILIIGLWSSFASCQFGIDFIAELFGSVVTPVPLDFFIKRLV